MKYEKKELFLSNLPDQSEEMIEVEINGQKTLVPIWKKVEDFPDYRVTYDGKVFCCNKGSSCSEDYWFEKKPRKTKDGYLRIHTRRGRDIKIRVHKMVLEAYVCKKPENLQCCHKDGDKTNNHISNLRWDTAFANSQDNILNNSYVSGEKHPQSILTEKKVIEIHNLKREGLSYVEIGKILGVSAAVISKVVQGKNWNKLHPTLSGKFRNGKLIENSQHESI